MDDLRTLLASLGYLEVSTYLQSGNVLFETSRTDTVGMEKEMRKAIGDAMGLDVPVLIRNPDELASVVAANPFPHALLQPARFYLTFLSRQPEEPTCVGLDAAVFAPEQFRVGERVIYVWYPEGVQNTRLSNTFFEKQLGVTATSRNWNTVRKLLELARG
jgi:uncharacterized protein (DUF1697 family)